jgi:hypothetical protein
MKKKYTSIRMIPRLFLAFLFAGIGPAAFADIPAVDLNVPIVLEKATFALG